MTTHYLLKGDDNQYLRLTRCPVRDMLDVEEKTPKLWATFRQYVDVYHPLYERGFLLVAGGVEDQPAHYLDGMVHIDMVERAQLARQMEIEAENEKRDRPPSGAEG